jgi:sulfur relay (sulfurtransferase) complex TusBCD TusD component (DsrE family)
MFASIAKNGREMEEMVLAAVTHALKFASVALKNDRDIVLAAVNQNGHALQYASVELKNDREVVLTAVTQNGNALQFASLELKNDRGVVLAAVTYDGFVLKFASHELQNDYEVMIPAVANGWASWDDKFEVFVQDLLRDSEHFMGVFLMGWGQQVPQKDNTPRQTNFNNNNKLTMLNKLGKYKSIQVKKLIADYAGVYHGERLVTAQKVLQNIEEKE